MLDDAKQPSVFAAVGAIAVVVLKSVSDVFKGPLLASILIVVAAGLLSALISRLYAVLSRRRAAEALLWMSPETTAATADPAVLGIAPARDGVNPDGDDPPRYVGRDIDDRVRAALETPNAVLLIVGAPLAGKSRTAFEAVRDQLGDARLLYPRNADALRRLADSDLARRKEEPIVLWLDDLLRYQIGVDAHTWRKLVRKWPRIKMVASMRTGDYLALCNSSGNLGETRRFLLGHASRFQLDQEWTLGEVARAREAGLEIAENQPVSRSFAVEWDRWPDSGGKLAPAPEAPHPKGTLRAWHGLRSFRPDVLAAALCGLLIAVLSIGLFLWLVQRSFQPAPPPPSVADQLGNIRSSAIFANDDVQRWSADLEGDGQTSYIFYSHSKAFGQTPSKDHFPHTDTLRIYDDSDTAISPRPAFVFSPTYVSDGPGRTGDAELFEKRDLADLIGAGTAQLVGVYSPANEAGAPTFPVITYWDETAKNYVVDALLQKQPSLAPEARPSRTAVAYRASYTRLSALETNTSKGTSYVTGYPVQDLAIVEGRNGPRLVIGYVAQTVGTPARISELEVQAWSIGQDQVTGDPELQTRCVLRSDPRHRFFVAPLPGLSYPTLLKEYWEQFDSLALC